MTPRAPSMPARTRRFALLRRVATTIGVVGVLAVVAPVAPSPARAQSPYSGFGFCPPPLPPKCASALSAGRGNVETCASEVESYVAFVFRYRACLAAEMERAVRQANDTIQAVKCAKDPAFCGTPDQAGDPETHQLGPRAPAPRVKAARQPAR